MFDKKVREPGKSVADDQAKRKVNPEIGADKPDEQDEGERGADEMQTARQGPVVFGNVKIPEFTVSFNALVFHIFSEAPLPE